MEDNEVREYKKAQKFYFNEEGKLVVESKKGVWVDGEQFVKMYGSFVCNAKTMGIIIQHFKGIPVEVGVKEKVRHSKDNVVDELLNVFDHTIEHYCILGADPVRIKEYEEEIAKSNYSNTLIQEAQEKRDYYESQCDDLRNMLNKEANARKSFNSLPWYKRIFK